MCRITSAVASAKEQGKDSGLLCCEHGVAAQRIATQYPTPVSIAEEDFRDLASEAADTGMLGWEHVTRIMEKYRQAGAVGVALVAKLGGTGYHVGRCNDNRSFLGGWAHVLNDGRRRAGDAVRKMRRTKTRELLCKVM